MSAYATPADFIERYDVRPTGDLVADDGVAIPPSELDTNTKLLTALEDASGEIEAALMAGGRYSTQQLTGLTGNSLAYLKRLTCELARIDLLERRMELGNADEFTKFTKLTYDKLERLRKGENLFNLPEVVSANLVSVSGPSTLAIESLNLVRDRVGDHYYPARRMPFGR
jgi:phage gp36-like protein